MKQYVVTKKLHGRLPTRLNPKSWQPWMQCRSRHSSTRQRRDDFWSPKVKIYAEGSRPQDTTSLLSGAGFIRQNYAGIFQFLPLGLRVLEKIERLIEKHMKSVGASKVSLSSISSQSLWDRSGRLGHGEMFKFDDRANGKWLLAPTHEEEITTMMQDFVSHSSHLPVRLYQIGRKYRDEQRPRGGLLRGREFVMKDLYTFDNSIEAAETTYHQVRRAYRDLFDELGVPYLEVRADSGNMGGSLSHEFHFPNSAGEDTVITCDSCDYARNEEFVPPLETSHQLLPPLEDIETQVAETMRPHARSYVSTDSTKLIRILLKPSLDIKDSGKSRIDLINTHMLKTILAPEINVDTGVESETAVHRFVERLKWSTSVLNKPEICYVVDSGVGFDEVQAMLHHDRNTILGETTAMPLPPFRLISRKCDTASSIGFDLLRHQSGDPCLDCGNGKLKVQRAIEIGHTFHLGTRYSSQFGLKVPTVELRASKTSTQPFVEMGCHGIGVTRLVAAAAACFSTPTQLRWPRAIAPYEVVICAQRHQPGSLKVAQDLYDQLTSESAERVDVLLDDREDVNLGFKMTDAYQIGYPLMIVAGRAVEQGMLEIKASGDDYQGSQNVKLENAAEYIRSLLKQKVV